MRVHFDGRSYTVVMGSDVNPRDGMYLALEDDDDVQVMEVYYDDPTAQFTVSTFELPVPLAAAEWLIAQARVRLPPTEPQSLDVTPPE